MNQQIPFDRVEAGRALGHDFRRWSGVARDSWPAPVREGFAAARAAGVAIKPPDRYIRKWLQLRESALRRNRVMADDVTPELLRSIDVRRCPITRVVLTHGVLGDDDWSIDRINNDGAYASNNLAVVSVRANRAKGARASRRCWRWPVARQATLTCPPSNGYAWRQSCSVRAALSRRPRRRSFLSPRPSPATPFGRATPSCRP